MATSSVIEVLIETLHGTAFELLVSPDDTVHSIKARISRLEGIPVSHQHLIWRDQELSDAASLRECKIRDGSAIKLVLGMRGGPINTRKACLTLVIPCFPRAPPSVEERPTLFEVAKYLDAKGEEVSLSIPKMRAMRMVVMREGDKVHLYTVVDRPGGLLREDLCLPHEPPTEEAGDPVRRQENLITRQKVDELQQRMRMCRLRKDEGKGSAQPPALPPVQPFGFQGSRRWANNSCWNRPPAVPRATTGVVLPQMMLPVPPGCLQPSGCHWRLPCQGVGGHGCQQQQPPARPSGFSGAIPKERGGPRFPHAQDHCRKCTALLERMYGLDRRGSAEGWQCSSKQPSVLLSIGQMDVPSAAPARTSPPRPDEGPADPPRNFFKVLPPVGSQRRQQPRRCCCVRPDRPAEQDVATASPPLPLEPLELDWTLERPRTAPTARSSLVRLPSLSRPPLRSPVPPEKGAASVGAAGPSGHDTCCPLLDEEVLDGRAAEPAFRREAPVAVRKRGPPAGVEGIRWALGDGGRRAASTLVSSRVHVPSPLLQRVHEQLWRVENPFRHTSQCWARLAADNQGDDPKERPPPPPPPAQGGPPTNGHPNAAEQDRNASAESKEQSAGEAHDPLSVDTRGGGSSELSSSSGSGGGGPADEDSNSTSESKTDEGASSADAQHPSPGKAKKKGKRCSWCNKKTGLASTYVCRCGNIFCAAHRYAEAHACSHDYKAEGRYILQRNNPVVKAAKLPKI